MARGSRRNNSTSALTKFLFIAAVVLVSGVLLGLKQQGVLGIKDHVSTTSTPTNSTTCKPPRVTKLSIDTPCDQNTRTGFRNAFYQCSDGATGTVAKNNKSCFNVEESLQFAQKACAKNSKCAKNPEHSTADSHESKSTPTNTITPTTAL